MNKHIAYWLDSTSDHDNPRWIVSEEDDDGSTTLLIMDADATAYTARQMAEQMAAERDLPVEAS